MSINKSWFKRIRSYIFFIVIVLGVLFYFNSKNKVTALVKEVSIQNRVVKKTVSASGSVKSNNQANISFATGGQITNIYVKEGQRVNAGQYLASIDSRTLAQTAASYQAALDIAKKERQLFVENMYANRNLYDGEEGYNIKLSELDKSIDQANANYQAQVATLSKTTIYAPFSGTVIDVVNKVGETVVASATVVSVADTDKLYFEINADQSDFGSIHIGQEVEVELDSYPGVVIPGRVEELPAQANSSDSNFTVKIAITLPENTNVSIGMTGDAYMTTETSDSEVPSLIYSDVQNDESGKPFVWVLNNKKIAREYIDIGIEGDIYTEIKSTVSKPLIVPASDSVKIQEGYTAKLLK